MAPVEGKTRVETGIRREKIAMLVGEMGPEMAAQIVVGRDRNEVDISAGMGTTRVVGCGGMIAREESTMPVKIAGFTPTTMERVEELRRSKGRRSGDPVMEDLLDAVEAGEPQDVLVDGGSTAKGLRIAIGRAAVKRGFAVETFASQDGAGNAVVTVVRKAETLTRQAQPAGNGRKRGRPRKQEQDEAEIASLQDLAAGEG